jgi:hypothetical protein
MHNLWPSKRNPVKKTILEETPFTRQIPDKKTPGVFPQHSSTEY